MPKLITHITGKELMKRCNMDGYRIWQIMKKAIPIPDDEKTIERLIAGSLNTQVEFARLLVADDPPKDLDNKIAPFQFALSEIEAIKNKRDLLSGKSSPADQDKVFPCRSGTRWEDIKITLTGDDTVKIETPQGEGIFSYHQLGMSNKNTRERRHTVLWTFVKILSENDGFISSKNPDYDPKFPDVAKRLNKHLKQLFGIDESIYQGHYKKMKGYKTKIFFSDRTKVVS